MFPRFRFAMCWLRLKSRRPPKSTCSSDRSRTASTHRAVSAPAGVPSWIIGRSTVPLWFPPPPSRRSSRLPPRRASRSCGTPSILTTLQEKERAIRAVLDRVEAVTIPSHNASPIIHICVHEARELRDPCVARCTLGALTTGHRERGIRAGRVDHAGTPAVRTGACRGAAVHPPRRLGSVVTQGIASKPLLSSRLPSRRRW